jgi:hypothetical protein
VLQNVEPPFIFTNTHNTISACSLPPDLSLEVMQATIAQFGGKLRDELGELLARADILESCDESIVSKDLSMKSFGSKIAICAAATWDSDASQSQPQ